MRLKRLHIENFRTLGNVDVTFEAPVSIIIGPNAVGKTTILEAIRFAKGILAPRTSNEAHQILLGLGAMSPMMPQRILPKALTNKPQQNLVVQCCYEITENEVHKLRSLFPQTAINMAQQNAGMNFTSPSQSVSFFSSDVGKRALETAQATLKEEMARLEAGRNLNLNLTMQPLTGHISGEYPAQQIMFSVLEQSLPPNSGIFSYFPADRALPHGEQPLQIGAADSGSQLESYNSQPQLKYIRLKNAIVNSIIKGDAGRSDLKERFELIFEKILRGRRLGEIGVNELGMLSIPIIDVDTGIEFQIDGLSSGEKGLILTFLLIAQNISNDGIILLDEPELHLNPAICRDLLQFFVDEHADKRHIQGIICSHSAEILAGAFERSSCAVFHLRDGNTLVQVRQSDRGEIRDALRRLGSSESEALLYKGSISVEGIHDVEILQAGFPDLLKRYIVQQRGGRRNIEGDISALQKAESDGQDIGHHYIIFDLDRKPSNLKNTKCVKLLQLDRYCLENFLLDAEILTDLSRFSELSDNPKMTVTDMTVAMRALAVAQLNEHAARLVFKDLGLECIRFDMTATRNAEIPQIATAFREQIAGLAATLGNLDSAAFEPDFVKRCTSKRAELLPIWEDRWKELCNGKQLLEDMRRAGHFKGDLLKLKKSVISRMQLKPTEAYNALAGSLRSLLGTQELQT